MSSVEPEARPATVHHAATPAEEQAQQVLLGGNELTTNSLGEYFAGSLRRIRGGDSGMLPVVLALIIITIIFQSQNGKFISAGNLVNLIEQGSYIIVFAMAEVFVLLLGEIDLSIGYNAVTGAVVTAELAAPPHNVNWFFAVLAGVATCTVIGLLIGLLVTQLRLPSLVVTLAFFLGLQGVLIFLLNHDKHTSGGSIDITNNVLNNVVNGHLAPTVGWIITAAAVGLFAVASITRDQHRRRSGLVTPPFGLTILKIIAVAIAGVVVILVCNRNRGGFLVALRGMPWVVPIVIVVLAIYTFTLNRTKLGRYLYAIGGNAEAARRAGISLNTIRTLAFVLAGFTAGIGGVIYSSFLGSASYSNDGGTVTLYAIAAAVIGGTSLFGGRGKMLHALLGGLVIAAIANGMAIIQLGDDAQFMVTGLVLLAAVAVDSLARRRASAT